MQIKQWVINVLVAFSWILTFIAIILHFVNDTSPTVQFVFAIVGMINMARMVGDATEELSDSLGDIVGGILSASCGNIPELIFSLIALFNGQYELLMGTLIGSVVSNLLLVLGSSIVVGSFKNGWKQKFIKGPIHDLAHLLLLGTVIIFIGLSYMKPSNTMNISVSVLLLITNVIFTVYQLKYDRISLTRQTSLRLDKPLERRMPIQDLEGQTELTNVAGDDNLGREGGRGGGGGGSSSSNEDPVVLFNRDMPKFVTKKRLILFESISKLIVSSAFVALLSEIITETCQVFSLELGLSKQFIGFFIIAFTGNAAEHWTSLKAAYDNEIDLAITTVETSGIQITMLIIPLIVLISYSQAIPIYMTFSAVQLGIYLSTIFFVQYIIRDNEANIIEGAFLLIFYLMSAIFYAVYG